MKTGQLSGTPVLGDAASARNGTEDLGRTACRNESTPWAHEIANGPLTASGVAVVHMAMLAGKPEQYDFLVDTGDSRAADSSPCTWHVDLLSASPTLAAIARWQAISDC